MLKNKITAKGLLNHGLLLMIPFNIGFVKKEPLHASHFQNAMYVQSKLKASIVDTNFVDVDSSVVVNSLPEIVSAPKFYLNASAKKYVKHFVVKNEEDLQRIKAKSPSYFRTIDFIFRKNEVPLELKYLAVIESELNTTAKSRTGAIGLWQMMAETARDFGLKVNKKTDERKHFYKSTEAAAKYLKSLYGEFNDWLLVVAAYNSGSGVVMNAIHKSGSRNFWKLQNFLPQETRSHVRRFVATDYYFEVAAENSMTQNVKTEKQNLPVVVATR